jgi:hypothetical protein
MSYAVYHSATNTIRTWVTRPQGAIPDGWEFRPADEVPKDAVQVNDGHTSDESVLKAYADPVEGIEIDTSPSAQTRFTSLVALIREGLDFGALTNESNQEIRDVHGVVHVLPVLRIRALMLRYGLHCKALFDQGERKDGESS